MAKFKLKISGIEELQARLKEIGKDLSDALEEATFGGALVVVEAAQDNSEKGGNNFPHRITGNLHRNIAEVSPAVVKKTSDRVETTVGSSMEYARRLELGFSDTDKMGRVYNQKPRPFLRPALDEHEQEVEDAIRKKFQEILGRYS